LSNFAENEKNVINII